MAGTPNRFSDLLNYYVQRSLRSHGQLALLSGVPKNTITNWLAGRVRSPQQWQPLVKVATALQLSMAETDALLAITGHPSLAELKATISGGDDDQLLARWLAPSSSLPQPPANPDPALHPINWASIQSRLQTIYNQESSQPAASQSSVPLHNLPYQLTELFGRKQVLAQLVDLLGREIPRLLTLTGPAGIGKTSVSIAVGHALLDNFKDGVWFVSLAALHTPEEFVPAVAQALPLSVRNRQTTLDTVMDYLRHRNALLILDNFEHLLDAAPMAAALLRHCARLKILVTSRESLRLYGEQTYPLPPLATPDPARITSVQSATVVPAIQLFVQRARAHDPHFRLTTSNLADVAQLCVELEGIPLAIELAASRIGQMTPKTMLARLDSRLRWLQSGVRDLPSRLTSLEAAIDWSYQLLSPPEQRLLRRLAPFRGGFVTAAALSVSEEAEGLVGEMLDSLVHKNLVQVAGGSPDEPRYGLLESVRAYGLDRLAQAGEEPVTMRLLAGYYGRLAAHVEPELVGPKASTWFDYLEAEHSNLRLAFRWHLSQGEPEPALQLGVRIWRFWQGRGHFEEGLDLMQAALRTPGPGASHWRARGCNVAGNLALELGQTTLARQLAEEGLAAVAGQEDIRGRAGNHLCLGIAAIFQAEFELAEHHLLQVIADAQQLHNPYLEGHARNNLGVLAIRRGDLAGARMHYEASLTIFESLVDRRARALLTANLAEIDYKQGDLSSALNRCRQALREWRQLSDHWGESATLIAQGVTLIACCRYGEALDALLTSLQLARAIPYPRTVALALDGVGRVQMEHGMYAQAGALFAEAAGHAASAGERHLQCYARLGYCQSQVASGNLAAVTPVLEEVSDLAGDIDDRHLQNELRYTHALICLAQGDLPAARAYLDQALAEESGRTYAIHRLDLLLALATVELESASPRAGQLLREAWAAAQQFGMPRRLAQAALRLAALAAKEDDMPAAGDWFQRAETTRAQTGFAWQPWEQSTAATLARWSEPHPND